MKRHPVLLFIIIHLFCFAANAQIKSPVKEDKIALFDQYIQNSMPAWKTTGLSVVIVKDHQVIFKKGYGVTDIDHPKPFTSATIAYCASTTKAMTAACIGMLVDEGKLTWDDKLKNVLPDFRLYDPYVSDEITVRDLLRHNAGLGNGDLLWAFGYSAEEITRRMRFMAPAYSLRSSFIYQNLMYVVAGEVIKKISGQDWHAFISDRIFKPLTMDHTYTLDKNASHEPSIMTPHFYYGDTLVKAIRSLDYGGYDPAGSVVSCADDMAKWMLFLQDSGRINGQRLIKAETFAEFFKPQSIVTKDEFYPTQDKTHPHWTTYGLGWFQQDYRGKMIQFHTGSLDGAIAIFGFIPDENFSIYIFANLDHSELRHALMWKAIDLWSFNDNSRDWSTELNNHYNSMRVGARKQIADREALQNKNTFPSHSIQDYIGTYSNEIYGDATIMMTYGHLKLLFPNNINLSLQHWQYDIFRGTYNYDWYGKSWINFSLNSKGQISSFDYDGIVYHRN